ncbi:MAG: Asp-tRNA(Asn)/Glu-tRNA(Gln) amidotransferase subunit GatB [Candidatus Woesearchaeota archaeon]
MKKQFTSDVVIGLEIHVELNTKTKLFCACATSGSEQPNTRTCPICLGHPGTKPVVNKEAIRKAIMLGLALNCDIHNELVFSRKSYFYPDLAKNFQITQYEEPLCRKGSMILQKDSEKKIGITRIHVEEDPAALVHPSTIQKSSYVLVDYNRSGNPLCEIVTEPDITSPEEARLFMKKLITILEYLDIFDTEEGIIKADANISIKESGYVRSEVKNITGFKEIERALQYEITRQKEAVKQGETLIPDTRNWDPEAGISQRLRTKESDVDYGYIIEPDLVVCDIDAEMVQTIRENLPELADNKLERFQKEHGIAEDTAEVLSKDKALAEMYEIVSKEVNPELAAKWVRRELQRVLNYNKKKLSEVALKSEHLISLLKLIDTKKITEKVGQQILNTLVLEPFDVTEYVTKNNLTIVEDDSLTQKLCEEVCSEQEKAVVQAKNGEEKPLNFLIGQVMRKSQGRTNPNQVKEIMKKVLGL